MVGLAGLVLGIGGMIAWRAGVGSPASRPGSGDGSPPGVIPVGTNPGDAAARPVPPQVAAVPLDAPEVRAVDLEKNRRISDSIRRARSSTVALEYDAGNPALPRRVASGVVINDGGEVLSIRIDPPGDRGRASIIASDASGHRHPARWVAADPETGLTLLRIEADDVKPIRQAAGDPSLGAEIFLIGNPYGLEHSVSRGHIAGLGRRLTLGTQTLAGLIQIQASLHPGDSGALLSDLDGGWLGLVRGGLAPPRLGAGRDNDLGFAISARDALWVADRLRAAGKVDRAYLGLKFAPDPEGNQRLAAHEPGNGLAGARVTEVVVGSPAAHAGLRRGDRVVGMDDRPIAVSNDLTDRLDRTAAGAELAIDFVRGTTRERVTIRATSRPPVAVPAPGPIGGVGPTPVPGSSYLPLVPKAATNAARPDELAPTIIQVLQDRLIRLEKRVEQLERERGPKSAANP